MILVVTLTVRSEAREDFRKFEHAAARVMARHGGTIERTVVIPPEPGQDTFREVHLVRFPGPEAFAAYRADPGMQGVAPLRERSVVHTEVLIGTDGPDYRAAGA
jgi:hypothetical protein